MSRAHARQAAVAATLALALGALAGCRGMNSSQPPIHLNPNMDDQKRFDPQERNDFFADGRAMRPQVPGTVAFEAQEPAADLVTGRGADGQLLATLPVGLTLDRAFLERGRQRFETYCTPCHDSAGTGLGTVVARGFLPPPSFHDDRLRAQPIGYFYDVVTNGVRTMPPYGPQIVPEDRWAVAAYVRVLQRSRMATRDMVPAEVAAEKGWQ